MKISIIGAGSIVFTPGLIDDYMLSNDLNTKKLEIGFYDIDKNRLKLMTEYCQKRVKLFNSKIRIKMYEDLDSLLLGSEFVITTILRGGYDARIVDYEIPRKYGVNQLVGDTTGIGLISRALRTIPDIMEIAWKMEKQCKDAWLINYTNPMSQVCLAVTNYSSIKNIGVCHGVTESIKTIAKVLDSKPENIQYKAAGINHLVWLLELYENENECYTKFKNRLMGFDNEKYYLDKTLLELFNYVALPFAAPDHLSEYFDFFTSKNSKYGERYKLDPKYLYFLINNKKKQVEKIVNEIKSNIINKELKGSGETAADIILCLSGLKEEVHVVNIKNEGLIDNISSNAVVELTARIGRYGVQGIKVGKLPSDVESIIARHTSLQNLVIEACVEASYRKSLLALTMFHQMDDFNIIKKMFNELLTAQKKYLPKRFK